MAGLSFLIYWVNMAIFSFIVDEHNRLKKLMLPAIVLLVVLTFGALRYDLGKAKSNITIKAAAIGTDSRVGTGSLPTDEVRQSKCSYPFCANQKGFQSTHWH
jgi:apolipoprotein N-acyltransferase